MTIRLAAVEDDRRYRASLETLFAHAPGFVLLDTFATGEALLARLRPQLARGELPPWDLALMDVDLPGAGGIACTRELKALAPTVAVVVVTVFEDADVILEAICAGADGYLSKRTPPTEILAELRTVMAGGAPLSAGVARTVLGLLREQAPPPRSRLDLTEREQDVLRCLVQGLSYQQAADQIGVSLDTVRSHVRRVYSKLHVHSAAQAVSRALREGLA